MRLSTRLSLFFLGALALVLLGFSATLYAMASRYLHRQVDERLEAVLNTLAAAAEVGPDGVEWEPRQRSLSFGRRTLEGPFSWQVADEQGERLDGSSSGEQDLFLASSADDARRRPRNVVDPQGVTWRALRRFLEPTSDTEGGSPDRAKPAGVHSALILDAAVSLEGVQGTLRNLALVLTSLSLGLWTLALVCGRRLSRRALRPLTTMAEAAQAIGGDEVDQRLPVSRTDDELEELGRSINALLDRLQDSFERQRRFTGDASHQLRTPLTAIHGQVELALRQDRDVEEYKRVLGVVQRKTRHLRQIVESLLFLARADNETLAPLLEPIDLVPWLSEHLCSWQETRGGSDPRLELETDLPMLVRAQPALLAELVNNLLDNAARYSEPAAPIRVRLGRAAASVLLTVEDRGIGIADDEIAHVFKPFYRSAEARRRGAPGLGLGLAVAERLASSIGGTIEVSSQVGEGSRFTIRMPLASDPSDGALATAGAATGDLAAR
jgi:two-component system OmpR family sensor kinase